MALMKAAEMDEKEREDQGVESGRGEKEWKRRSDIPDFLVVYMFLRRHISVGCMTCNSLLEEPHNTFQKKNNQ